MTRRRRLAALVACTLLAAVPVGMAHGDEDEEEAEAALARGAARPVHELLQRVRSTFAGNVLKIELEHEDGVAWIYEVKLLTPEGDVLELEYDAASLDLIKLEGRYRGSKDHD